MHRQLKIRAAHRGHSMEEEVRQMLRERLSTPAPRQRTDTLLSVPRLWVGVAEGAMKGFLLDTEALLAARLLESAPESSRRFLKRARRERWIVCVSAVSLAAVGRRLVRLRKAQRMAAHDYLRRWLDRLTTHHPQAVLPFDGDMAVTAAHLQAMSGMSALRAQIGACALVHDLAIVTARPERYEHIGVRVWPTYRPTRWPTGGPGASEANAGATTRALLLDRNSAAARGVRRPLGPVPGLASRRSRLRWGYGRWRARHDA